MIMIIFSQINRAHHSNFERLRLPLPLLAATLSSSNFCSSSNCGKIMQILRLALLICSFAFASALFTELAWSAIDGHAGDLVMQGTRLSVLGQVMR